MYFADVFVVFIVKRNVHSLVLRYIKRRCYVMLC